MLSFGSFGRYIGSDPMQIYRATSRENNNCGGLLYRRLSKTEQPKNRERKQRNKGAHNLPTFLNELRVARFTALLPRNH